MCVLYCEDCQLSNLSKMCFKIMTFVQHATTYFGHLFQPKKEQNEQKHQTRGIFSIAVIREVKNFFLRLRVLVLVVKYHRCLCTGPCTTLHAFSNFFFYCIFFIFYLIIIINVPLYISQVENNRNFTLVFPYIYMRCSVLSTSTQLCKILEKVVHVHHLYTYDKNAVEIYITVRVHFT